jgi:hypothetical protein
MIGFIGASLLLHFQLQSLITAHNRWLSKAHSISFLDYECFLFHGGWLVNQLLWLTNTMLDEFSQLLSMATLCLLLTASHLWLTEFRKKEKELYYDQLSVGQSVLVSSTHLRLTTRFLLLSDYCKFVYVGHPLWQEDGSVFYHVQCIICLHFTCYLVLFIQ